MNNKLQLTLALLIMLFASGSVFSQRAADNVVSFDKNIESILVSPYTGSVIVKDKDAISSYNPDTKQIEWKVTDKEISSGNAINNSQNVIDKLNDADFLSLLEKKNDLV